jgi:hypothetical protein
MLLHEEVLKHHWHLLHHCVSLAGHASPPTPPPPLLSLIKVEEQMQEQNAQQSFPENSIS